MNDIDIVVTWVDGSDKNWLKEKSIYSGKDEAGDSRDVRYRDWDTLRYWFRGIEKFAPWVRKIHFVTWGHVPEWLDTSNPKLNIVRHSNFIPKKYLPTFSSHPIEWNIHRIRGLSENFIYFNDDCFIVSPVDKSYFFKNGLPCDRAIIGPYTTSFRNSIAGIVCNDIEVINTRFSRKEVMQKHPLSWFNPKYGKYNIYNVAGLLWPGFTGLMFSHFPAAYKKSTFETLWKEEYDIINETCMRKFRDKRDINHWLVRYWQIVTNNFVPADKSGQKVIFTADSKEKLCESILSGKNKIVCMNDSESVKDFDRQQHIINKVFEKLLPQKSRFEK